MRGSRTLAWSLAREIVQYTLVGFVATAVVVLSQNLLRRMDDLTTVGFTGADLLQVLRCLLPMLTAYTIPVALLFGAVLAIRRRVSDAEVLAMRACGLGLRSLVVPTLCVGIAASATSAWLLIGVEHEARQELIRLFNRVAARGGVLKARDFQGIGQRVIYVAERHRDDRLEGVMISDRSQSPPFVIFAEEGRLSLDGENALLHLALGQGELHIGDGEPDDEYRRVLFDHLDYEVDVSSVMSADTRPVRPKQMSLDELRGVIARGEAGDPLRDLKKREPVYYQLEIHRRFALPLAPLLFSVAAVPLALVGQRSSRAWGPLACAGLAFGFYALLTLMQYLARAGWIPAAFAFWLPSALLFAAAVHWLRRVDGVSTA